MSPTSDTPHAVVYTDEGPKGAGGQDCHTTSSWSKVWLFPDYQQATQWLRDNSAEFTSKARKRPTWRLCEPASANSTDTCHGYP